MKGKRLVGIGAVIMVLALFSAVHAARDLKVPAQQPSSQTGIQTPSVERIKLPDLIIPSIAFKKVVQKTDTNTNKTYWIFNVIITVKNQGPGNAGPFTVLLERNIGPGGAFDKACQTCEISVAGLGPGASITLDPRQFNNHNPTLIRFQATADSLKKVLESNESNNSKMASFIP